MSDPIRDLEDLKHEGMNVNPLPAAEVRRRGTRLRRRNNALAAVGALAVIAVIATPLAVVAHGGDHAEPGPGPLTSPSPSQTAQAEWLQSIPGDFHLTALPADATFAFTARGDSVVDDLTLCGVPTFSTRSSDPVGPAVDTAGAVYGEAGTESSAGRTLALYQSDAVAAKALDAIRHGVATCPVEQQPGAAPLVRDAVPADLATDESYVFTQQSRMDKDLLADLTVFQVARVGNALYLATNHTSAGGQQVVDAEVRRMATQSAPVLSDMCVFAADPCGAPGTAPASASPLVAEGAVSAIPADFPLDRGIAAPEGPLDGPSATSDGVPALDLCGASAWPATDVVERLAVTSTMPQYRESRELVTFARTDEASGAIQRVVSAAQGCSVMPGAKPADDKLVDVQPVDAADLGGPDETVTFSITYRQGLGGGIYQFVRVGRAVYGTYVEGEFASDSIGQAVPGLSGKTKALAPELCIWTVQGC